MTRRTRTKTETSAEYTFVVAAEIELVRPEVIAAEVEYVRAARGVLARVWRATVAARRCDDPRPEDKEPVSLLKRALELSC